MKINNGKVFSMLPALTASHSCTVKTPPDVKHHPAHFRADLSTTDCTYPFLYSSVKGHNEDGPIERERETLFYPSFGSSDSKLRFCYYTDYFSPKIFVETYLSTLAVIEDI